MGLNPASGNPFADNGAVPNGNNVAFLQGTASLATTISGLVSGQTYTVTITRGANQPPVPGTHVVTRTNDNAVIKVPKAQVIAGPSLHGINLQRAPR